MRTRRASALLTAAAVSAALATAATNVPASAAPPNDTVDKLTKAVKLRGVMNHLEAFQRIADKHGDRAAGRKGYRKSVNYVVRKLERAGYDPTVQEFSFPYVEDSSELERVSPQPRVFGDQDFYRNVFEPTFQGEADGPITPVDVVVPMAADAPANTSTSGCEESDFDDFTPGGVALMQRGTCDFTVKALNAQEAGAVAAVVMNEGQPGRTGLMGMSGDGTGLTIPVVAATYDAGVDLHSTPGATVRVLVDFFEEERTSWNVLAETKRGDRANTVMAGAHLDGVQDGAGINDNGSGSAALLETAIQMKKVKPANRVRFAWWGAEEEGLLGSDHYVSRLKKRQIANIALYLNFDMVASPNFTFGIYDGNNSSGTAEPGFIPKGSARIEKVFEKFYDKRGLRYEDSEFSGRSDYGPFIAVGIPAGGLFTGAEGVKTKREARRHGGVAGESYDPCYHSACDNLTGAGQDRKLYRLLKKDYRLVGNVNTKALDVNSDAIATAVLKFARDTSRVRVDRAHGSSSLTSKTLGTGHAHGKTARR
ncbi:M20/M25/M40 family metallo-hydrolase [Nocardioides caldifontis]|uniref:M20/M25/M40 family metallo-hydrolase n=1 Tax=Nocardioides caldifontis TaxID=2588938 RepID=UPI0011DFC750|nr:M20/M25/M40 family metallo-hydrolase [Nocardioides caldifontis]